jgi:hypothetical protein
VPDGSLSRIRDAFDAMYPGRVDAGRTKPQWTDDHVRGYIKEVVQSSEAQAAAEAARATKIAEVDTLIG